MRRSNCSRVGIPALGFVLVLAACAGPAAPPPGNPPAVAPPPAAAPPADRQPDISPSIAPVSAANPQPAELRRVAIAVPGVGASSLIQYCGVDYGIYAEHGFDVQIQQMRASLAPAALVSNQVDYFTGVETSIRVGASGVPTKVVAVSKKAPTFGLIVRPDIQSVAELRGRPVGAGSATGAAIGGLRRVLEQRGMSIDDVQMVFGADSTATLVNLLQGITDAASLGAPEVFEAQDQGFRMLVYMADQVTFLSNGLAVADETLANRRDEVRQMVMAEIALARFVKANKDRAVGSLVRRLGISPEAAARAYDFEVPALTPDVRVPIEEVEATLRGEVEAGRLSAMIPASRVVAFDLIEEAMAQAQ
jgi:ABC-type nitrate/sulfonate/bicarbonate transport system substrate-binding protein